MLKAKDVALNTCDVGTGKVGKDTYKVLISAMFSGMFIGFGFLGYIILAGGAADPTIGMFLGALVFPVGIILIVLTGTDLFTGNCLITMGFFNKCYGLSRVVKNLTLVFIGNFLGALFFVFLVYYSDLLSYFNYLDGETMTNSLKFVHKVAEKKAHLPFGEALFRGILCNIIVSVAVYGAYAPKDATGKILALLLPITLFVVSGYEHSVANMFILPLGFLTGADVTLTDMFIGNLLPVTIGNIIGGAIIVPLGYYALFLTNKKGQ